MTIPVLPAQFTEENPLIVDNSILSTLATCSTRTLLTYGHHLVSPEDSLALLAGQATHKALETYFLSGSPVDAYTMLDSLYKIPRTMELDPEEPLSWDSVSLTFLNWLDTHSLSTWPYEALPKTVERPLMAPLWEAAWGKRVLFLGLVDLIVRDKSTGLLSIMDHKTTSRYLGDDWKNGFSLSSQLSGYLWLAETLGIHEQLDSAIPISTALINTIQFTKLPTANRKCKTHAVPYPECRGMHAKYQLDGPFYRTPPMLAQWLGNARLLTSRWIELLAEYPTLGDTMRSPREGVFQYDACRWCPFPQYCRGLIPTPEQLPGYFKVKPWRPWGEAKQGEAA